MHKLPVILRSLFTAVLISLVWSAAPASQQAQQRQDEEDEIRKIWDDGLIQKRRAGQRKNYSYRRVTPALPPERRVRKRKRPAARPSEVVVGVTVWKLRPSLPTDEVRELVQAPSKKSASEEKLSMTAERMEAGAALDEGEHVRISIESPRTGYVYVINRESYADGTKGRPLLIFPTERTLEGDNRIQMGRVVTIPALADDPPYFTVRPNPRRKDQVAESLLLIIADRPLDLPLLPEAQALPAARVNELERNWRAASERIEQVGGVGVGITPEEFAAGGGELRELTQGDPAPQTVYRMRVRRGAPVLLKLDLPFKRSDKGQAPSASQ